MRGSRGFAALPATREVRHWSPQDHVRDECQNDPDDQRLIRVKGPELEDLVYDIQRDGDQEDLSCCHDGFSQAR
jgi:hypothetical protein